MSSNLNLKKTSRLFCKPVSINYPDQLLYNTNIPDRNTNISFRSLHLETDMDFLFDWVNRPYSKRFWQLNGSRDLLHNTYQSLLNNPHAHSFIGCCNNEPVCQIDLYNVAADELKDHVIHEPDDCGLHLLMMPPEQMSKGLSLLMLQHFIRFYFSFPIAERLFAEPDSENILANRLAVKAGFTLLKKIQLSYKTANLYSITKQQFHASYPIA